MKRNMAVALKSAPMFRAVAVLSLASLLLLIAGLMWVPAYLTGKQYETELEALSREVQKIGMEVAMRKAVLQGGAGVSDIIGKINQTVTQTTLVSELNDIVSRTGVTVAEQAFHEVVDEEEGNVQQFKQLLHVSGEYKKVRYFLSQIQEKLAGLNVIERISLTQGKDEYAVDARIELVTYSVSNK